MVRGKEHLNPSLDLRVSAAAQTTSPRLTCHTVASVRKVCLLALAPLPTPPRFTPSSPQGTNAVLAGPLQGDAKPRVSMATLGTYSPTAR
jgi:hypothetical protein